MEEEARRYLVLFQIGGTEKTLARIQQTAPGVKQALENVSGGDCQLVFASNDGGTFGFFIRSTLPTTMIRSTIETHGSTRSGDSMLVLEIGEKFAGIGFSRGWNWLQHH